jgi:hypothetical protein
MKRIVWTFLCFAVLPARLAEADTISTCTALVGALSCTGTLDTPEDVFLETFTLAGAATVTVQTYGFGGGTNAAGGAILPGGFDSLVALFSGPPLTASILTDGGGNPIASVPGTSQFYSGCPPSGNVTIGGIPECGDSTLVATLAAGTYTLLLSDANYLPFAVSPGPPLSTLLSDGFSDLSGGVFATCNSTGACLDPPPNGSFAVDITGLPAAPVPEPSALALLGAGLGGLVYMGKRRRRSSRP